MSKVYANYSLGAGLTFQKGPFKYKKNEQAPVQRVPWKGGGVAAGGQGHAGHGNYEQWMNPTTYPQAMIQPSLPTPSHFASVVSAQDIFRPSSHRGPPGTFQQAAQVTGQPSPPSGVQKAGLTQGGRAHQDPGDSDNEEDVKDEYFDAQGETYDQKLATKLEPQVSQQPFVKQEPAGPSVVHSGNQTYDYDEASHDNISKHQRTEGFGQQTDPTLTKDFNQQTMVLDEAKWADRLESLVFSLSDENAGLSAQLSAMTTKDLTSQAIEARNQKAMGNILRHFNVQNIPEYINPSDFEGYVTTMAAVTPLLIQEREALENFARGMREYTAEEEKQYKEYQNLKAERSGFVEGSRKRHKSIYEATMDTSRIQRKERHESAAIPSPVAGPSYHPFVDRQGGVGPTASEGRQGRVERLDMSKVGGYKSGRYNAGKPSKNEMKEEYPFPKVRARRI